MKRILFIVALIISTATFAQKEEIKVLKRLDNMESKPSQKDMDKMTEALTALDSKVDLLSDEDKVLYHYFKVSQPIMEVMMVAMKNPNDLAAIQKASLKYNSPEFLESMSSHYNSMKELESKLGKKEYTEDIKPLIDMMKQQLSQAAFQLNTAKKYKEASEAFYSLYKFDNSNGSNLENAAILAVQAQDYKLAEKYYDELKDSDYLNNATLYYAVNKASGTEETFPTRESRLKVIQLGTHEKPREEKASIKKPEVYKILALVSSQNGNFDKAKIIIDEALKLNPEDKDLKEEGSRIFFNEAYEILKDDQKLVDEINQNLDKKDKYDELSNKRMSNFEKALPKLEKAYMFDSQNQNTKSLLKISYEILGMKEKAASIN